MIAARFGRYVALTWFVSCSMACTAHAQTPEFLSELLREVCGIDPLEGNPLLQVESPQPVQRNSHSIDQGRDLFAHEWQADDPQSPRGDGLGPMRNAASCAACHHQGVVGGAGPNEFNVDVVSIAATPPKGKGAQRGFANRMRRIHPGFVQDDGQVVSSVVLHRHGGGSDYDTWRYKFLAGELVPPEENEKKKPASFSRKLIGRGREPVEKIGSVEGIVFQVSQRNTPALFGAGQIDSIAPETLQTIALEQTKKKPHLAGRVPKVGNNAIGRFGWRGQSPSLKEFVLTACANELGLQVEGHPQPANPVKRAYRHGGVDLDTEQCDALVAYVHALPAPQQLLSEDPADRLVVYEGKRQFQAIGCADCHMETVGQVVGLYSDLLLHDMGEELSDPVSATPAISTRSLPIASMVSSYSGGSFIFQEGISPEDIARAKREWRTPPLWGVRDSAPYLHDGRAATVEQAIALHGGQAERSVDEYFALSIEQRAHVLAFLNSLAAPDAELPATTVAAAE